MVGLTPNLGVAKKRICLENTHKKDSSDGEMCKRSLDCCVSVRQVPVNMYSKTKMGLLANVMAKSCLDSSINHSGSLFRIYPDLKGYLDFSSSRGSDRWRRHHHSSVPVVVGLEGARLVEPHVLGLLVGELGEVRLEGREVQRGHELVHQLGHQIDVGLVPARGRVEQFCKQCTLPIMYIMHNSINNVQI